MCIYSFSPSDPLAESKIINIDDDDDGKLNKCKWEYIYIWNLDTSKLVLILVHLTIVL